MSDLPTYLTSAFRILEQMFARYDVDGAGKISFQQLVRCLALAGFRADDVLHQLFQRVQHDQADNDLDFSEFLVLMYLWSEVGNYNQLIRDTNQADTVKSAFEILERCYIGYDADKSRQLSHDEFNMFMTQQLPQHNAAAQPTIRSIFPPETPILSFSKFLLLIYKVLVPGSKFELHSAGHHARLAGATGSEPALWKQLTVCFKFLEQDFRLFDKDGSNCISLGELTEGVTVNRPSSERLDVLTRMEYYFRMVDVDRSESIDFFEFMYLAFLITQNGSYRDLVDKSANPAVVKECFNTLRAVYKKYDADGSNRLTIDEVQAFMRGEFGQVPATTESVFNRLRSSPDRPHIDFVRFMRLLYEIVTPQGAFVVAKAQKPAQPAAKPEIQAAVVQHGSKPPRFENIAIAEIKKGEVLGKGGQGIVYRAEYKGHPCGCKFLLEGASPETCKETKEECELMFRMDHPNVHFLLGFKASMPDICLLTELCDSGSMFDCYMKKRMRFDKPTQWRFARECASGINVLHTMHPPFMHRDIKSLNVFMTSNYVCKVADFGMAKDPKVGPNYQGMGTPQWCAPEVLSSTHYDQRADVFSYAIMLWEITHMQVPYMETGMNQAQIARAVVTKDIRPPIAPSCPPGMAALIKRCWDKDPARRPTLTEVIAQLDTLRGEFGA